MIYINELPVSWLITINASPGGSGPNEDSEGMVPIGNKGKLIAELGMDAIPVIILESKAFVPALAQQFDKDQHFVRWNEKVDNPVVGESLVKALKSLDLPYMLDNSAYVRNDSLEIETKRVGQYIAELGTQYAQSKTSSQKVKIAAELSKLITQDVGGSIFMSDAIFKLTSGGGLWPGQSAVLSTVTCKANIDKNNAIVAEESELQDSIRVVFQALAYLHARQKEAQLLVQERSPKLSPEDLLRLI